MVAGPAIRYESRRLVAELRAQVAKIKGLAVDFRIDLDIICARCQNPDERKLAKEGEGVTKQLALDLKLPEVPPRFHWERPRAAALRTKALKVFDGLPRTDDAGTMDRERLPWEYSAVHKDCKHCRHFEDAT
ncbi:MAG: hypothetical protein ACYC2H_10430 [Thermoplasmatota archaeon]